MEAVTIGLLMVLLLVAMVLHGIHVGIALPFLGFLGLWAIRGNFFIAVSILPTTAYWACCDYAFAVLPLFMLMGTLISVSGISEDLYYAFSIWLRKIRGSLAIGTVLANALFAAATGISIASAAVFSKIAVPQMFRSGYDRKLSLGTVGGSSILGMLIPPSALLIIYGILSSQAIGLLFIAGIVPGLLLTVIFVGGIMVLGVVRPDWVPKGKAGLKKIGLKTHINLSIKAGGVLLLVVLVLGGIYGGLFTPTEAGAVGAMGALLLTISKKRATFSNMSSALLESGYAVASIFFLLIGAQLFSRVLALSGVVTLFSESLMSLAMPPITIILMFMALLLVMGTFLDSTSIMFITLPLLVPVVETLGFNLIWFGIVAVMTIEVGLITPPFGMCAYAIKSALGDEVELGEIFVGCSLFVVMILVALGPIVAFPSLSTWLVSLM